MSRAHLSLVATLAALAAAPTAEAQSPHVFFACYVPNTGTVYRIKEPGLREQCTSQNHVGFSWIDGLPGYAHSALNGLAADDHPQYLLAAGTRALLA